MRVELTCSDSSCPLKFSGVHSNKLRSHYPDFVVDGRAEVECGLDFAQEHLRKSNSQWQNTFTKALFSAKSVSVM
jgi:hypothetical protein